MADLWVLTGGIGSGKTTIRDRLDELGAVTIDADRIGHDVLEPGGPAFDAVAARWPSVIRDGRVDRSALGEAVFSDRPQLRELEAITHPVIASAIASRLADAGDAIVVVEVSVPKDLLGVGWRRTIVADLPVDIRKKRLLERGMHPDDIERRMASQPSRDGWRARGRWIISTEGSRADVARRVNDLWDHMTATAG